MMAESDIGDLSSLNDELATLREEHGTFSPLLLATIAKVGKLPLLFRKASSIIDTLDNICALFLP